MCQAPIRRGTAISPDHAQLVHTQWTHAAERVESISTHDNTADLPSRDAFEMLRAAEAEELEPIFQCEYWSPRTSEVLHEGWSL